MAGAQSVVPTPAAQAAQPRAAAQATPAPPQVPAAQQTLSEIRFEDASDKAGIDLRTVSDRGNWDRSWKEPAPDACGSTTTTPGCLLSML